MSSPHVCFADMPEYEDEPSRRHKKKNIENDENDASGSIDSDNIANDGKRNRRHSSKERSLSPGSISPTPTAAATTTTATTTPRYERNLGFFQQLSRRFGLRSNDDLLHYSVEEDAHSSSTDSSSSSTPPRQTSTLTSRSSSNSTTNASKDVHGSSMEHISCASSETSSTIDIEDQQQQQLQLQQQQQQIQQRQQKQLLTNGSKKAERKSISRSSFSRLHRRSTSSIRRAFENFSLSSRSLSCSGPTPPTSVTVAHKNGNGGGNTTANNSNNSSYGGTPIKSALKSSSNTELNKRSAYFATSSHSFSVSPNSSSSNNSASVATAAASKNKTKAPPQRILRQPVSYTYLKGISGLPTQRVPRNSVCCQYARR